MAETIYVSGAAEKIIVYVDANGRETTMPLPNTRQALRATLALLRSAGRSAYVAMEWHGDKRSRVGIDTDIEQAFWGEDGSRRREA